MDKITIRSFARVHTALLNESGYLGRIDGGIGFSIDSPFWEIMLSKGSKITKKSSASKELEKMLESMKTRMQNKYKLPSFSYQINEGIESHIGLGAKTSLLMGFGNAVSKLFDLKLAIREVAQLAARGGTSGIGVWASQVGGFIWDAGRSFPDEKSEFSPSSYSKASSPLLVTSINLSGLYICHFRFHKEGISGIT